VSYQPYHDDGCPQAGLGGAIERAADVGRAFSNALLTSLTLALLRADPLHPGSQPVRVPSLPVKKPPDLGAASVSGGAGKREPTPGVTVVVYEDFFAKASNVAVQLLKVCQGVSLSSGARELHGR
jgi:hypothetical protein